MLVKRKSGRSKEAGRAGLSHRSAHHNLCSLLQSFGLLPHAASSVHGHGAKRVGFSEALALRVDLGDVKYALANHSSALCGTQAAFSRSHLLTELSGGTHDDSDGSFSCLQLLLVHDVNQHRPNKGCGFTTAGLGYPNHVTSGQSDGNTLREASTKPHISNLNTVKCRVLEEWVEYLALDGCGLSVLGLADLVH